MDQRSECFGHRRQSVTAGTASSGALSCQIVDQRHRPHERAPSHRKRQHHTSGAGMTLRIAQPDNGWRVEVDRSGTEDVEVTFHRGDIAAGGQTHVKAVCSAGTPVFTVENKD